MIDSLLEREVRERKDRAVERVGQRDLLLQQQADIEQSLRNLTSLIEDLEKVHAVLQSLSERLRLECQQKIESLVTMGLQSVFDQAYEFLIQSEIQRGVVSMRFLLRVPSEEGYYEVGLFDSVGGGILDVVSFLLRIMVLTMTRPRLRKILLLDEVFSHVSREHLPNVAALLRKLTDLLKIQILLVTHSPELGETADLVYRVKKEAGNVILRAEN